MEALRKSSDLRKRFEKYVYGLVHYLEAEQVSIKREWFSFIGINSNGV